MRKVLLLGTVAALTIPAQAALFDWEDASLGTTSSLSQTVDGIIATASSSTGGLLVYDNGAYFPTFGNRSIWPDAGGGNFGVIRIDFSQWMSSISVWVGDNGADDDGNAQVVAYDNADTIVSSHSLAYGMNDQPIQLEVNAPAISYILLSSGGNNPNSLMWDNLNASPVPEPATMAILGLTSAALLRRRRN